MSACATEPMSPPGHDADLSRAVGQPLRDLSVIREAAPPLLQRAAIAPYDLAGLDDCRATRAELAALDAELGPDLTPTPQSAGGALKGLAADLVSGAVGLPFRGVVRRMSGAQARERVLRAAVLSGMVRRGFVKGRLTLSPCPVTPPAPTSTPTAR